MTATVVDRVNSEFEAILAVLERTGEISLRSAADDNFRKSLLLSVASYFERRLSEEVAGFVRHASSDNQLVVSLVQNKAISRQFHTWFAWNAGNANSFFGLFGDGFKSYMAGRIAADADLKIAIAAFLELGENRNRLVHQDYGNFTLEKTSAEIFKLYESATKFVDAIPAALRDYSASLAASRVTETSSGHT